MHLQSYSKSNILCNVTAVHHPQIGLLNTNTYSFHFNPIPSTNICYPIKTSTIVLQYSFKHTNAKLGTSPVVVVVVVVVVVAAAVAVVVVGGESGL